MAKNWASEIVVEFHQVWFFCVFIKMKNLIRHSIRSEILVHGHCLAIDALRGVEVCTDWGWLLRLRGADCCCCCGLWANRVIAVNGGVHPPKAQSHRKRRKFGLPGMTRVNTTGFCWNLLLFLLLQIVDDYFDCFYAAAFAQVQNILKMNKKKNQNEIQNFCSSPCAIILKK